MANTYTLISSNVLTSTAASVAFSSIPATYTDLVVRASLRAAQGGAPANSLRLTINSSTTNQSWTQIYGDGSTTLSSRGTTYSMGSLVDGQSATASTFSNLEIYIPSYTVSQNKPYGTFGVTENNSATAGDAVIITQARLWSNTAAITNLSFDSTGVNFAIGSSFYLYGVKNA